MQTLTEMFNNPIEARAAKVLAAFDDQSEQMSVSIFPVFQMLELIMFVSHPAFTNLADEMTSGQLETCRDIWKTANSLAEGLEPRICEAINGDQEKQAQELLFKRDCLSLLAIIAGIRAGQTDENELTPQFSEVSAELLIQFRHRNQTK